VTTATRQPPNHETLTCVKHYGCLRPECIERHRTYQRERYRSRTAGTWKPLIEAEPVRQHILKLYAAGFSPTRIGELAGIPSETVIGFVRAYGFNGYRKGRKQRCTPEVAAKILAIAPDAAKPGIADATGTRRRLQALVAAGWPMQHLGPRIGVSERTVRALVHQERVYGRTAEAVTKMYEQLAGEKPEQHDVSRISANRARSYAAKRRWATVKYWTERMDAIDDKHFEPMYGLTRREIIAQDANLIMRTTGLDKAAAAARLGVDKSYVDHAFRDHPEYAIEVAA
jgi:hypothetical protein